MNASPDLSYHAPAQAAARMASALALTAASLVFVAPAASAATAFAPTQTVQGTPLVLQGAGTRYRAIFKVYDMALYLPRKVRTAEEDLMFSLPKELRTDTSGRRDARALGGRGRA